MKLSSLLWALSCAILTWYYETTKAETTASQQEKAATRENEGEIMEKLECSFKSLLGRKCGLIKYKHMHRCYTASASAWTYALITILMEHLSVSLHHSYWFDLCDSHINIKKINTHYLNPGEENICSRTTLNVHSLQRFSPKGCNSAEMCSSQHLLCFRGK